MVTERRASEILLNLLFKLTVPTGQEWPNYGPHPARQILHTFFSSTTFPTVDSSATELTAACLLLTSPSKQNLPAGNAISRHFNNLFLHSLRKFHCIRPSSGEFGLGSKSKSLATPAIGHEHFFTLMNLFSHNRIVNILFCI